MSALGCRDDDEFAELLLNEAGVAVVPGSGFGAPGHMRLSFACSMPTLEKALDAHRPRCSPSASPASGAHC